MLRPLLVASAAVALMLACSQRPPRTQTGASPKARRDRGLVSLLRVDTADNTVHFALAIANESDRRVEIDFPDGQTHDFVVQDAAGRPLWRWSAGRLFTQGMQNRLLEARDTVVFDEAWAPGRPGQYVGEYIVAAELRSETFPVRTTTRFSLR